MQLMIFIVLQYTFGNNYVGRASQGDFVFLDLIVPAGRRRGLSREENYFSLECKDERLWISVNGVEVI